MKYNSNLMDKLFNKYHYFLIFDTGMNKAAN